MKRKGAAQGPYGPDNPPPPPPGRPPRDLSPPQEPLHMRTAGRRAQRRRRKRDREFSQSRRSVGIAARSDRGRSRSPAYTDEQNADSQYRERSPPHRGSRHEHTGSYPYQGKASSITHDGDAIEASQWRRGQSPLWRGEPPAALTVDRHRTLGRDELHHGRKGRVAGTGHIAERAYDAEQSRYQQSGNQTTQRMPQVQQNELEDEVDWDDESFVDVETAPYAQVHEADYTVEPSAATQEQQHRREKAPVPAQYERTSLEANEVDLQEPAQVAARGHRSGRRAQRQHMHDRVASSEPEPDRQTFLDHPTRTQNLAVKLSAGGEAPATTYDLRGYDHYVTTEFHNCPKKERFFNGNGKVAPAVYGSEQLHDLGLCFSTFCTRFRCEMGLKCPWRHHPLSKIEVEWILNLGGHRGRKFLEQVDKYWACPEVPLPGASIEGKGD